MMTSSSNNIITSTSPSNRTSVLHISLKWSKQMFEFEFPVGGGKEGEEMDGSTSVKGLDLKRLIQGLTNVPISRQKVLLSGKSTKLKLWKGPLQDDFDFDIATMVNKEHFATQQQHPTLSLTVLGSAEVLEEQVQQKTSAQTDRTKFIEDMTPEDREAYHHRMFQQALSDRPGGYIPAIQYPPLDIETDGPGLRQTYDDEVISYNRLVHGLSQHQIGKLLSTSSNQVHGNHEDHNYHLPAEDANQESNTKHFHGKVVMTMGLELQRAYVNDIDVLRPSADANWDDDVAGTIITGFENGHVQLWRNCQRLADVIHEGPFRLPNYADQGVTSVLALAHQHYKQQQRHPQSQQQQHHHQPGMSTGGGVMTAYTNVLPSFATAGRCTVRLWTSDAECVAAIPAGPQLPQVSPTSLIQLIFPPNETSKVLCIAARFNVIMPPADGAQRHLTPQDEAGRQRLEYIQAREQILIETLEKWKRSIQIWYYCGNEKSNTGTFEPSSSPSVQTTVLELPRTPSFADSQVSPAVTSIASWSDPRNPEDVILAAGDSLGRIHFWSVSFLNENQHQRPIQGHFKYLQSFHFQIDKHDPSSSPSAPACSIACMKYDTGYHQLFVSTAASAMASSNSDRSSPPVGTILIPVAQAVYVFDIDTTASRKDEVTIITNHQPRICLNGHKDAVQNILPLPNGDIVTAGGKMDATLQVWSYDLQLSTSRQDIRDSKETKVVVEGDAVSPRSSSSSPTTTILTKASIPNLAADDKVGYVFALTVLNNAKEGCNNFAIAIARYNVVKVLL